MFGQWMKLALDTSMLALEFSASNRVALVEIDFGRRCGLA